MKTLNASTFKFTTTEYKISPCHIPYTKAPKAQRKYFEGIFLRLEKQFRYKSKILQRFLQDNLQEFRRGFYGKDLLLILYDKFKSKVISF